MPMQDTERLSDVVKLSAHVTRVLGQNPGMMTLQGTNSYLLQPPSNPLSPLILIDTSSPHTAQQYVDILFTHLFSLGMGSGLLETHFESNAAKASLKNFPEEKHEQVKETVLRNRREDGKHQEYGLFEYGDGSTWSDNYRSGSTNPASPATTSTKDGRKLPNIEHIVLTHRHLDHVGALPLLLETLKSHGCPPPKLWKLASPDESELCASERDRPTSDGAIWQSLPAGTYHPFSPLQPFHPIIPGLMISILDPQQRHLLVHEKDGKPRWNDVPEIARVSVRCLKTPGHTKDSVSLVMLEGEKGVFTGDTVLGQGTTTFAELGPYMTSLRTLLALKPNVLYPAHGPHIGSPEACRAHLEEYILHRQQREEEIVSTLRSVALSPSALPALLVAFKKGIHEREEAENRARGPLMADRRKAIPMPDFEDERKAFEEAVANLEKSGQDEVEGKEKWSGAIPTKVLKRLLYKSEDERLLFAATKSVAAHLVKLEQEGKVKRTIVQWPKMMAKDVDGSQKEAEEAWGWIGESEKTVA